MAFTRTSALSQIISEYGKFRQLNPKPSDPNDKVFEQVANFMGQVFSVRNPQLRQYEDFFVGGESQKMYMRRFEDETEQEFQDRLERSVIINMCRLNVLSSARMLYAASQPLRRMEDQKAHKRMFRTWQFNKVLTGNFHLGVAIESGIFGYTVVENRYVNKKTKARVAVIGRENDNQDVWYVPLNPMLTVPIQRREKPQEMGALIRVEMEDSQDGEVIALIDNPKIIRIEYITDTQWLRWATKETQDGFIGTREPVRFGNFIDVNPYGDINIPFTLYRNVGERDMVLDGESDLVDVCEPQTKLNETESDVSHVIEHNTWPILFGAGFVIKTFKRGVNSILSHRSPDADLKYVTWDANLEAMGTQLERLQRQIRESGGFSPVTFGNLTNIGQVRNLRGAMVPEVLSISHKQARFSQTEKDHAEATMKIIQFHETEFQGIRNLDLDIKFEQNFIPTDELTQVEADAIKIKTGLENVKDIIRRNHPELETEEEVDKYIEEMIEVNKELGLIEKDFSLKSGQSGSAERKEQEQMKA